MGFLLSRIDGSSQLAQSDPRSVAAVRAGSVKGASGGGKVRGCRSQRVRRRGLVPVNRAHGQLGRDQGMRIRQGMAVVHRAFPHATRPWSRRHRHARPPQPFLEGQRALPEEPKSSPDLLKSLAVIPFRAVLFWPTKSLLTVFRRTLRPAPSARTTG